MTNSRAALVEAAFAEFTTKGYEAATVAGIAERAGVTTGALYAHFAGKLDLLQAAVGLTPVADIMRTVDELGALRSGPLGRGLAARPDPRRVLLLDVIVAARRDPHVAGILRGELESYVRATARATGSEGVSRMLAVINLGMIVLAAIEARTPPASVFERLAEALMTSTRESGDADAMCRVRSAAAAASRAQEALHDAIADAVDDGNSLRQVGAAAGLSHEAVRRIASDEGASR
jgi:AcrR family transcriptional regulator